MLSHKPALVGLAVLTTGVAMATPGLAAGNKTPPTATTRTCPGGTVTLNGPLVLWPPNHQFVPEPVTAKDSDSSTDNVTLTLTPSATDATGGDGGPQHNPDWQLADGSSGKTFMAQGQGSATAELELRAERSGKGDGRTYTINWAATFDNGTSMCSSSDTGQSPFTVTVPHDQGH